MPARWLQMRKIREVLRLKHEQGLSHQAVARACAVGVGTVNRYLQRAAQCGLVQQLPTGLEDPALDARLFRRPAPVRDRARPACARYDSDRGGAQEDDRTGGKPSATASSRWLDTGRICVVTLRMVPDRITEEWLLS